MPADSVRLRTHLMVPPREFVTATAGLSNREVGALIVLASWWWSDGRLPEDADLGRCLGIRTSRAEAMMPALRPFFAPGGFFAIVRGAALAKRARRAVAGRKGAAALHGRAGGRRGKDRVRA